MPAAFMRPACAFVLGRKTNIDLWVLHGIPELFLSLKFSRPIERCELRAGPCLQNDGPSGFRAKVVNFLED